MPSIITAGFSGWCPAQSEVPRTCTCSPLLSSASNCLKFGSRKLENVPPPNIEIVCCLPSFDTRARPNDNTLNPLLTVDCLMVVMGSREQAMTSPECSYHVNCSDYSDSCGDACWVIHLLSADMICGDLHLKH